MADKLKSIEGLSLEPDLVDNNSITERLGQHFLDYKTKSKEDLPALLEISDSICLAGDVPDRNDHYCGWNVLRKEGDPGLEPQFTVCLTDRITFESSLRSEKQRILIAEELVLQIDKSVDDKMFSVKTPLLVKVDKEVGKLGGWEMKTTSQEIEFGQERVGHMVELIEESGVAITLTCFIEPILKVSVPLVGDIDRKLARAQDGVSALSEALGLSYPPQLKYRFMFEKDSKINDSVARGSRSFTEYFHGCLGNLRKTGGDRFRAILSSGKSGQPVLILEDPTLRTKRQNLLEKLLNNNSKEVEVGINAIADNHPSIYTSFYEAIQKGLVNSELIKEFMAGDFHNWFHVFVNIGPDGRPRLESDFIGSDIDGMQELIRLTEEKYGLFFDGQITEQTSEQRSRQEMFMPLIESQTAALRKTYGSGTAKKFRTYAISTLIMGNLHTQEVYESYLKLVKKET